jgi:spore maturation protein CgeB
VWGGDGKSLALKYPKEFIIHEYVSAQECENIMTDVKIVLNYSPRFADGAHDRVYGGMLAGAVCVTNPSEFLKEHFLDGEDIIYYDEKEPDVFVEKIKRLISDKAERERISHNAYEKVKGDTWGARVAELLKKR